MNDRWDGTPDHDISGTDEWATPSHILRPVNDAVGGFDLDPCSGAESRSIAPEVYTESDDGLTKPWFGSVWVNPPYSDMESWCRKMRSEAERGDVTTIVTLVPARTSTQWFHKYITDASVIVFVEGRLRFGDADSGAPFPSLLAAFGETPDELISTLSSFGIVFRSSDRVEQTSQAALADW